MERKRGEKKERERERELLFPLVLLEVELLPADIVFGNNTDINTVSGVNISLSTDRERILHNGHSLFQRQILFVLRLSQESDLVIKKRSDDSTS